MTIVIKDIFLKQMLNILKIYLICIAVYHSYQKERKLKDAISLYAICLIKKEQFCLHKSSKTSIESWAILEKVHRVIWFNQEAWLKQYFEIITQLRTEAKNDFEKDYFKLMNNFVFGKAMENVRMHRDIK